MKTRSAVIAVVLLVMLSAGCKVRRVSDGKPPRNGVVEKEVKDPKYGTLRAEDHYREGRLYYSKGLYSSGAVAFERFWHPSAAVVDSNVAYYPSGKMNYVIVSTDDRILYFREYFENGATKVLSDTSESLEFYQNGVMNCRILFKNGLTESIERWHENGKQQEISEWRNDQRHGKRFEWDSTGKQIFKEYYQQGTRVK